jgi:hypothetical protein
MEWLRIHKAQTRVWFIQKMKGEPYHWGSSCQYPNTTYFQEDCQSFQVGLVVHGSPEATGTVLIKTARISGPTVLPRDPQRRIFLFDFGPPEQELEDEFSPVNEFSTYTPEKGYGWIIPEAEKIWYERDGIPNLDDAAIAAHGLPAIPKDQEGWYQDFVRKAYWLEVNDKKLFYSTSHGWDYVEFFKKYLDLKTPLERDFVGMARPYHFAPDPLHQRDIEERPGWIYIDDDLSAEFYVDLPNGRYNLILGVGYSSSTFGGSDSSHFNVEVQGKVRKQDPSSYWLRPQQNPIRDVPVTDGRMKIRLFCDVRKAMDTFSNHNIGVGWMINYLLILPAEDQELMGQWEWKIIKRRGEIIRRVTFVPGDPAHTRNEGNFLSINGKPFYFHKLLNNYHPGATQHYAYYCLNDILSGNHPIGGSAHFFRNDWEKLSYSDDYPWQSIDQLNMTYTWGYLSSLQHNGILSFVPHAASGEGSPTVDARGRSNRYNIQPPLNSALGKEIQKEAYTMMSNQLRQHPAVGVHFIYEELWHPDEAGYDDQSLLQYRGWLERRYGTIVRLNEEWGRKYPSFDDIVQPQQGRNEWWEYTPEFVEFRKFRGWAQREMVRSACDLVRRLEPEHYSWGAKGDFGTQSWYTGEFLDGFGWYTPYVAASVARHFHRTAIAGGYQLNCEHAYVDGRRQADHKAGPRQYLGRDEADSVYAYLISSVFKGVKGFFSEWYEDGTCHAFHRTSLIKEGAAKHQIKRWTGELAFYEPPAFDGPPVNMDRNALYASAANQMLFRLAPLWLPAKPPAPKVLFPTTEPSFFLDFLSGERPYADFETVAMRILRSTTLPADFVSMSAVKDLSAYQLIIIGDTAQAIPRAEAQRIREFVRKGGKLILVGAGGFSEETQPRRCWKKPDEVYPLEEFAELGGYRLVGQGPWNIPWEKVEARFVHSEVAPEIAEGTRLGQYNINFYYEPGPGSRVFLKGRLPKEGKDVALGLLSPGGNVAVVNFPPKEAADELVRPLARWFRKLTDRWQIDGRVSLAGADDAWDLYAGYLEGDGYTLATACNLSGRDERQLSLRLGTLPPGEYAVTEVTGAHPDFMKKSDGGLRLRPDPAACRPKIDHHMSAEQLARQGIPCRVRPLQAQVFLIRPAAAKTWVSIWKPSLQGFVQRPVTIAYGTAPGEKPAAEAIRAAMAPLGVGAKLVAAGDVKRSKIRHEVRIDPLKTDPAYREDMSTWYLVDSFDNEVVDTTSNLILVGSGETNALVGHLGKPGSFAYDKMLEKIGPDYPGPGRGVIGTVESINSAVLDLRSQSRDAIIAGGSDAAGTQAAVDELIRLLRENVNLRR